MKSPFSNLKMGEQKALFCGSGKYSALLYVQPTLLYPSEWGNTILVCYEKQMLQWHLGTLVSSRGQP